MTTSRVLSIDGGGYLGLATAAFIRGIEDHFSVRLHDRFDLFCGTSTGAILALALANGRSGCDLVELYRKLGPCVFPATNFVSRSGRGLRSLVFAKYSNGKLREVLTEEFGDTTLGDLRRVGRNVLVTSFCLTSGAPRLFKTDHSANLTRHDSYSLVDVALASASAPTFLPLVEIVNPQDGARELFCDGGVAANHPALLGFTEAIAELGAQPKDIGVLSLGTPRLDLAKRRGSFWPPSRGLLMLSRGLLLWGGYLASTFTDSNSKLAHEILKRLVQSYPPPGPRYCRVDMPNRHRLPMDLTSKNTADILVQLGAERASSNEVRDEIKPFLDGGE